MNHKDRKNIYKRSAGRVKQPRQFILYVEGQNTEKSYFDLLKKTNCKIMPVVRRGHGISRCVDFVNDSENAWRSMPKEERDKYDKRWLVFDADGRSDFADGIKLARRKGFCVAFSNMCIEYWFMLHFHSHDGREIPLYGNSHSAAQIRKINEFIRVYNRTAATQVAEYDSDSKKVADDFFDLMLAIDPTTGNSRIVTAFEQAKSIHEAKVRDGCEPRESVTTIYELLFELGVIEKNKNSFSLYRK